MGIKENLSGAAKDQADIVWRETGGEIVDQIKMAVNDHKENEKNKIKEKDRRLCLTSEEIQKRMEAPANTEADYAGHAETLLESGKPLANRGREKELAAEIKELKKSLDGEMSELQLKQLEANLEAKEKEWSDVKIINDQKEAHLAKLAMYGGLNVEETLKRRPDLVASLKGIADADDAAKAIRDQINKMYDEGVPLNRINRDAYGNKTVLETLQEIYKRDPEAFKRHMESRGAETQEKIAKTLSEMLKEKIREESGRIDFDRTDPAGEKNFQTAATLAILQGEDIGKVFQNDPEAIENFIKQYWKDLAKFTRREDQLIIAKNIGEDTFRQFGRRDLNPAERRNFIKILLEVHNGGTDKTGILDAIYRDKSQLWMTSLKADKDAAEINQLKNIFER